MIERKAGGSVIDISSTGGMTGLRGGTVYGAAKGGLNGFTVRLAGEVALRRTGERLGAGLRGCGDVGRVARGTLPGSPSRYTDAAIRRTRGDAATFPTDGGACITGQTVVVDGGIVVD